CPASQEALPAAKTEEYFSRSGFLSSFPVLVFGRAPPMIMILSGTQNFAILPSSTYFMRCALSSSSLAVFPSLRHTIATGLSPHFSSLAPITAASNTDSWCIRRSSSRRVDIHSPPLFTTSLSLSLMTRYPLSSTVARSPVWSHPPRAQRSFRVPCSSPAWSRGSERQSRPASCRRGALPSCPCPPP